MLSPLELMYFMAKGHEANKRKEREGSMTTYAMHEGKMITIGPDEQAPEGATPFAANVGGNIINLPKPQEPKPVGAIEAPIFSRNSDTLPKSEAFAKDPVGATTRENWDLHFRMERGLAPQSTEYIEAMQGLQRVGSADLKDGQLSNYSFKDEFYGGLQPTQPSSPVKTGPSRDIAMVRTADGTEEVYYLDTPGDMTKMTALVSGYDQQGTEYNVLTGVDQELAYGDETKNQRVFDDNINNQVATLLGIQKESGTAGAFASPPISWTEGNKTMTFVPSPKSEFAYNTDMMTFVQQKVGVGFDWTTMDKGSLNTVYNFLYEQIRARESEANGILDDKTGNIRLNPEVLKRVSKNKYPTIFEVGRGFDKEENRSKGDSFERYYYARTRGQNVEDIKLSSDRVGPNITDTSFSVDISDVQSVRVPQIITDEQDGQKYVSLLNWFAETGFQENTARGRLGNAIRSVPSIPGQPSSTLIATGDQYALRELATFASRPSNGTAATVLTNATYNYDPRQVGFVANRDELDQVASSVQSIPPLMGADGTRLSKHPTFNSKLNMVSVFSPALLSPQEDLEDHYLLFGFQNRTFKGKQFDDMQAEEAAIARQSLEAARLVTEAMSLVFIVKPDGSIERTPFGQSVGEGLLTISSFYENVKAGFGVGIRSMGFDENNPMVKGALGLLGQADSYAKAIDNNTANTGQVLADQFGQFGRASASYFNQGQNPDEFRRKEEKARADRIKDFNEISRNMNSTDSVLANAAQRKYLQYVIAYSVASALQGGTGGRTISDQDVQNVLNFLSPGMSTPDYEYQVMDRLREDLMYKAQRGAALSSGNNQTVFDAMILADLEVRRGFSVDKRLRDRLEYMIGPDGSINSEVDTPAPEGSITFGESTIAKDNVPEFITYVNRTLGRTEAYQDITFSTVEDLNQASAAQIERLARRFITAKNKEDN